MEFVIMTRWPLTNADVRYLEQQIAARWPGARVVVSPIRENYSTGPAEFKQEGLEPQPWPSDWR